jgi:hypothetical protein
LNLFQVNFYLSLFNWIVFITVFYIGILVVALTIVDIVYVSYAISMKKFSFLWPIKVLRQVCGMFVTGLFLPLLELFFMIPACETTDEGTSVNTTANDIVCWEGMHILYTVSAILVSSVFIVIAVVIAMTYYDISTDYDNPSAKYRAYYLLEPHLESTSSKSTARSSHSPSSPSSPMRAMRGSGSCSCCVGQGDGFIC